MFFEVFDSVFCFNKTCLFLTKKLKIFGKINSCVNSTNFTIFVGKKIISQI